MRNLWLVLLFLLSSCCTIQAPEITTPPSRYLYESIVIEIQPTTAIGIIDSDLNTLKDRLDEYRICQRSDIRTIIKAPVEPPTAAWYRGAVLAFENLHRTIIDDDPDDAHLRVYISILPGQYLERGNGNIIGLAFHNQHIALFNNFNFAVLLHEFGHVIGLVDRDHREGDPVNPDRPNHCNIRDCVMFWQVNKRGRFDDRCRRDLERMIAERHN